MRDFLTLVFAGFAASAPALPSWAVSPTALQSLSHGSAQMARPQMFSSLLGTDTSGLMTAPQLRPQMSGFEVLKAHETSSRAEEIGPSHIGTSVSGLMAAPKGRTQQISGFGVLKAAASSAPAEIPSDTSAQMARPQMFSASLGSTVSGLMAAPKREPQISGFDVLKGGTTSSPTEIPPDASAQMARPQMLSSSLGTAVSGLMAAPKRELPISGFDVLKANTSSPRAPTTPPQWNMGPAKVPM